MSDDHPRGCIFGGFSIFTTYWLADPDCALPHPTPVPMDATCKVCGAAAGELHDLEDDAHRALAAAITAGSRP